MGVLDFLARMKGRSQGVTLALGGGGARGLAHIGVLEVLEDAGIRVAAVAGTSAGAAVGGMWAALGSAAAVEARWREFFASGLLPGALPDTRLANEVSSRDSLLFEFARRVRTGAAVVLALERRSLIAEEELEAAISFLLPEMEIEHLPLPFAAVLTDFETGEAVAVRRGSLQLAVTASSAVPGAVPPVAFEGRAYVDGGLVADVPVEQARALGPWPVVAVSTGEAPGKDDHERIKAARALMRAGIITHHALRQRSLAAADLVIAPLIGAFHWSEFSRFEEIIAAGRVAATAALPELTYLARSRDRPRIR